MASAGLSSQDGCKELVPSREEEASILNIIHFLSCLCSRVWVWCECHSGVQRSEGSLRCQSLSSSLLETRSLVCYVHGASQPGSFQKLFCLHLASKASPEHCNYRHALQGTSYKRNEQLSAAPQKSMCSHVSRLYSFLQCLT